MDHRDWERGELVRRGRSKADGWGERLGESPADPYSRAGEGYLLPTGDLRPAGGPRAAHRRGLESAERYLPLWARDEDAAPTSCGRHRHAGPDHDADDVDAGYPARWRTTETTSSWQRVTEIGSWDLDAVDAGPAPGWPATTPAGWILRPRHPVRRGRLFPTPGGRGAARPGTRARADLSRTPRRLIEDDLLDGDRAGVLAALLYTGAWYAVPVLILFGWLMTLDGRVPAGCVTDVTGGGCESPRAHALVSLVSGAPQFGTALLGSLVVAAVLGRVTSWRSATVGLAAAVMGGGLTTVLLSALSGQPPT